MGTGEIGMELFIALKSDPRFELSLLITGQDKPIGRKMVLTPPKIKLKAIELGVDVLQPQNIKATSTIEKIQAYHPDFIVVMAYGQLLSEEVLNIPKIDCLNCHTSLLPKYRGASPIQTAILNGDKETGVSLMKMAKKMDAGAVYSQFKTAIKNENTQELSGLLSQLTAKETPNAIHAIGQGTLKAKEQNELKVSHVKKIEKSEGQINWQEDAEIISRKVRAFYPWPSTYTFSEDKKRLKILKAEWNNLEHNSEIGEVSEEGIACKIGYLKPKLVQPEGKKPQDYQSFLNGNSHLIGTRLA